MKDLYRFCPILTLLLPGASVSHNHILFVFVLLLGGIYGSFLCLFVVVVVVFFLLLLLQMDS